MDKFKKRRLNISENYLKNWWKGLKLKRWKFWLADKIRNDLSTGILIEDQKRKIFGNLNEKKNLFIDTTLKRSKGVDFSIEDQDKIANVLSEIGIDYIEVEGVPSKYNFSSPPKLNRVLWHD